MDAHVDGNSIGGEESQSPGRLWDHDDRIHQSVDDTSDRTDTEQGDGQPRRRIRQQIKEANGHEWKHVLQIVTMSATDSLHIRIVKLHLQFLRGKILGIGKGLEIDRFNYKTWLLADIETHIMFLPSHATQANIRPDSMSMPLERLPEQIWIYYLSAEAL